MLFFEKNNRVARMGKIASIIKQAEMNLTTPHNRESFQLPASTNFSMVEMISSTSPVNTSENHIFCG